MVALLRARQASMGPCVARCIRTDLRPSKDPAPVFPVDAELSRVITRGNRTELIKEVSQHRLIRGMIPPIRRIPAGMLVVNDKVGNIDKVTDQLENGVDIEGWAALPWKHELPDASFVGNLNEDGSVDLLAPILIHKNRRDIEALGGPSESGWQLHLPVFLPRETLCL